MKLEDLMQPLDEHPELPDMDNNSGLTLSLGSNEIAPMADLMGLEKNLLEGNNNLN